MELEPRQMLVASQAALNIHHLTQLISSQLTLTLDQIEFTHELNLMKSAFSVGYIASRHKYLE